ncbi:MAG: class I SAM-dependent methyltransferase [Candidatus Woesearchaeota archaeon]
MIDEYKNKLRTWYNKTASRYDKWGEAEGQYTSGSRNTEIVMFNQLLDSVKINAGTKILDVGCGTGIYLIEALKRGGIGSGIDISKNMIEVLSKKLIALGLKQKVKSIRVGDAFKLDYPRGTFDLILCIGLFDYYDLPDVKTILLEMKKVGVKTCQIIVDFPNINNHEVFKFQAAERSVGHEVFIHNPVHIRKFLVDTGFEILKEHIAGTEIQFLIRIKG